VIAWLRLLLLAALAVAGIVIGSIGIPAAGASVPPSDAAATSTYDYDAPAAPTTAPGNTRIPAFRSYDATSKLSASGTHANSSRLAAKGADDGLAAARRARDQAGRHPDGRPNRDSPVYVGGPGV